MMNSVSPCSYAHVVLPNALCFVDEWAVESLIQVKVQEFHGLWDKIKAIKTLSELTMVMSSWINGGS